MGLDLFEACDPISNDDDLSKIEIDQKYARRMEHNKKRESLQRLQELKKRGLAGASDDSEESSEEDEDDLVGSGKKDLKFYETLVKVKKQDPILRRNDVKLFSSDEEEEDEDEDGDGHNAEKKPRAARKEKPLYLKDVMAKHLIEEGPEFEEKPLKYDSKIYKKEQSDDIRAFLEAEKEAFGSNEGDIIKEKETAGEEMDGDDNSGEIHRKLNDYFGEDNNLNEKEIFLKNYLLNKMWIDREKDKKPSIDVDVSEDEDELEKQDKYEAEYNFRYEQAEQADRVLGHSRFIEGSVRKKTNSRKLQRKSKEERMAQAEFERKEELKHLKNLKKKEIQEKLEKIRAIAGIGGDGVCKLNVDDLDEDFDPEDYDRKMREMFNADYYGAEDADPGFGSNGDDGDIEKPDFDKEDELLGLPKDWDACGPKEGFAATRERVLKLKEEEEEPQKEEGKRKRKRKISLKEKVELDKELEEYYKLDYEDTIGDLKTRFKYKPVSANRYGLRAEEILTADDKNLNQYVSLKKLATYREDEWKVTHHQKLNKNLILEGGKSDTQNVSKKHVSKGGHNHAEAERKIEPEESKGEASGLSRNSRRRRRQAELKPSFLRRIAYGKIPSKTQKKH